ncbi:bone morphogenetic protein 10 [Erpetoichthys calabaricus]|uniref:bone morphogenetic protein 10 n=1 Tax=Erpetoichthys calabaricus TaxID=27687 RepID=UPI00109FB11B|nr:bone morphogenetic protein 10 [Erpetoichthys calabaricus]
MPADCARRMITTLLCICMALSLLIHIGRCSPIMAPDDPHPGVGDDGLPLFNDPLMEQDSGLDFQSLIRSQFLKTFNLSDIPHPEGGKVDPPEYMLELYNKFANDRTSMPSANIVRSFKNEDMSLHRMDADRIRKHSLLFNLSIPHHEKITMAELRLYTLVERDRRMYEGVDRKVTIYEVMDNGSEVDMVAEERGEEKGGGHPQLTELASRQVYSTDSGWEAFDLTNAVHRWRKSDYTTHRLEVHIESVDMLEEEFRRGNLDIDINPDAKHDPLLIVFSDDQSKDKRGEKKATDDMVEQDKLLEFGDITFDLNDLDNGQNEGPNDSSLLHMGSNLIYDSSSRIRRNAKGNFCKKIPLYVDFKDIGWDSWIIAPPGYEAYECKGICSYPFAGHIPHTNHATVQTLLHISNPLRVARACCVPTKLNPMSILYLDNGGIVTYKYKYDDMIVAECGCR